MWVFGALLALFGFLSSIKATTERATEAWLRRKEGAAVEARNCGGAGAFAARPGTGGRHRARLDWPIISAIAILIPQNGNGMPDAELPQRRC